MVGRNTVEYILIKSLKLFKKKYVDILIICWLSCYRKLVSVEKLKFDKNVLKQAEAEVVPSSSSVKVELN